MLYINILQSYLTGKLGGTELKGGKVLLAPCTYYTGGYP